jgi:hypothetical protein
VDLAICYVWSVDNGNSPGSKVYHHTSQMDQRLVTFLKSSQCRCNNCCFAKSPKTVEVKDAGNLIANGVFERITTDQGSDHAVAHAIEYKKRGDTINGSSAIVSITLSKLTQGSYWSIRWKPHSYSSETHYLYETSIKVFWDLFPPRDGWYICPNGEGTGPPPTLVYDPDFRLGRITLRVGPDKVSQLDTHLLCLSDALDSDEAYTSLIRETAAYWSYACEMQLESDREKICAALFEFIFADDDNTEAARSNVVQLLDAGSRREQCIVLELAIWKSLCTMQYPNNLHGILDMFEWCRRGWKIRKQEARHRSNEFHVIISSVLPFLDSLVDR